MVAEAKRLKRWTADEVMRMVAAGILTADDPVELIEGELIEVSPQGDPHRMLASRLTARLARLYLDFEVQAHSPVRSLADGLPEPDVAVIREETWDHTPTGSEVVLVIEVSVTSRALDRRKAYSYARAGMPTYWRIDVPRRVVEVHTEPSPDGYELVRTLHEDGEVALPETDVTWPVADLLPPPGVVADA